MKTALLGRQIMTLMKSDGTAFDVDTLPDTPPYPHTVLYMAPQETPSKRLAGVPDEYLVRFQTQHLGLTGDAVRIETDRIHNLLLMYVPVIPRWSFWPTEIDYTVTVQQQESVVMPTTGNRPFWASTFWRAKATPLP